MVKKFNHLNVPSHWEHYWTKYPEGYTILEALLNWVAQVDNMIDNVNEWNEYLDNFVATFDENLQGKVTSTLSEWQDSGFLDVVIDEALQTQMDVLEQETHEKLNQFSVELNDRGLNVKTVFNVKGDNSTDDIINLQNAINHSGTNAEKIFIPDGKYKLSDTLILKRDCIVEFSKKAILIPTHNNVGVLVEPNVKVYNLNVDVSGNPSWNSSLVRLTHAGNFELENIWLKGNSVGGIAIDVNPSGSGEMVYFGKITGNIRHFKTAVNMETKNVGWSNSLTMDLTVFECDQAFKSKRLDNSYLDTHNITLRIQAVQFTEPRDDAVVEIDTRYSIFNITTYDLTQGQKAVKFGANSLNNTINVLNTPEMEFIDFISTKNTVNIPRSEIIVPNPISNNINYLGYQSNFLAYAHKRFNVTTQKTQGITQYNAPLTEVFNYPKMHEPNMPYVLEQFPEGFTDNDYIQYTIDFHNPTYISLIGLVAHQTHVPKNVEYLFYDSNDLLIGSKKLTLTSRDVTSFVRTYEDLGPGSVSPTKVVIKISNPLNVDRRVGLMYLFALNNGGLGSYPSIGGDIMVGDLEFISQTGVVLTSPNGIKYRLRVDEDGVLTTHQIT